MLCGISVFFFFKQKTAYEMRISDWSSDVCSSDLPKLDSTPRKLIMTSITSGYPLAPGRGSHYATRNASSQPLDSMAVGPFTALQRALEARESQEEKVERSEEHTSELQSLMRISYAVFCLKKKNTQQHIQETEIQT